MSTPKVRFKGFTDDWEQRKLGDVIDDLKSGLSRELQLDDIGIPVVRANNVDDNKLDMKSEVKYWYKDDPQGANTSNYLIHKDDILINFINSEAKMGTAAIVEDEPLRDTIYTTNILRLRTNEELHPYFFLMETNLAEYKSFIKAITKPAVNQASFTTVDYKKYDIKIPDYKEQARIGGFFKKLENLITSYQRKCDELKKVKKYMLQKMFPKKGEKVPEIRFAGFTGDWEQRKISDMCSISTGKSNTQDKVDDGEYPFYVRSSIIERSTKYLYDEEAVLTVGDGVGTGKVFHYVNGKYDLHQRCYRMYDFTDALNAKYFYHVFSKLFYNRVMSMTAKTSVDSVRMEMIADMKIPTPNIKEQEKVEAVFTNLDNLIALHQRRHDTLKEIKKYMLQNMFPKK